MTKAKLVEVAPEDALDIQSIEEAAQKVLAREWGIKVDPARVLSTIAYEYIKQAIAKAAATAEPGSQVEINLFNLITVGVEHSDIEGEKDGNFVPYLEPGQEMKLIVKSDGDTEE